MINDILFALWIFLPAGLANASPVFANKVPFLHKLGLPIDGGKHFRGKRIFGDHKTIRGFGVGVLTGAVTGVVQYVLYSNIAWIRSFAQISISGYGHALVLGVLLGFGALFGDAIKSFFKRQFGVASGKTWFPFDQTDYIVGGLLFSSLTIDLPHSSYIWIGIVWFLIHPTATFIGWLAGLKDSPI